MDENKYNELDKLFQSRLDSQGVKGENWNTPSEGVFDRAMADVHGRRRRPFPFLWLGVGLVVLALLVTIGYQSRTVSQLEDQLSDLQDENVHLMQAGHEADETLLNNSSNQIINSRASSTVNKEKETKEVVSQNNQSSLTPIAKSSEKQIKDRSGKRTLIAKSNKANAPAVEQVTQKEEGLTNALDRAASSSIPVEHTTRNDRITMMLSRPLQIWLINSGSPEVSPPFIMEDKKYDIRFSTFVDWSVEMTTLEMTNLPESMASLTGYDKLYIGSSIGAGFRTHLNRRWSVDVAGAYHRTYNKSEFKNLMAYEKSNENNLPGGIVTYTTPVQIASTVGNTEKDLTMTVTDLNIQDQDNLKNHTYIDQNFSLASVKLGPRYHFLNSGRFEGSLGVGARLNYLINLKERMQIAIYYGADEIKSESVDLEEFPMLQRYFGGAYANLELNYDLSEHFSVGLESGYYRSLTSLKSSGGVDPSRTYLNAFNLNLKFIMHL